MRRIHRDNQGRIWYEENGFEVFRDELQRVAEEGIEPALLARQLSTDGPLAPEWFTAEAVAQMDAAVLSAYGWPDLLPQCRCEFLLDYEDEDDDESEGKARKRKKPWRYRWPDEIRDEVLARLLELNEQRHKEELLAGKQTPKGEKKEKATKSGRSRKSTSSKTSTDQQELGFHYA